MIATWKAKAKNKVPTMALESWESCWCWKAQGLCKLEKAAKTQKE
jgi:hypothetical protein